LPPANGQNLVQKNGFYALVRIAPGDSTAQTTNVQGQRPRHIFRRCQQQQPREQGGPSGRKFGNGSFCGIRSAVRYLPPEAETFWGLQAGLAQVPRSPPPPPPRPAPAIFAQLLGGRGPLGLPGGANGPKVGSLWAAGGTARSRQDEPIERRPARDPRRRKKANEGVRISAAMAIAPPSI
jgi:hypothetical protein